MGRVPESSQSRRRGGGASKASRSLDNLTKGLGSGSKSGGYKAASGSTWGIGRGKPAAKSAPKGKKEGGVKGMFGAMMLEGSSDSDSD